MNDSDQLSSALEAIRDALNSKTLAPLSPELQTIPALVNLRDSIIALRQFALSLANGDLSQTLPLKGDFAGVLKSLQADLRHLTWQTQMIASGDFSQRVDFMGEFSQAFNSMVVRLDQAWRELQTLKEFNESIVQNMMEGIVLDDTSGNFIFVNRAAAELFGYTPEEMMGRHWTNFFPPEQLTIIQDANQRRQAGRSDRYEVDIHHRDGTRRTVLVSGTTRFENGRFAGTIAVFTDITARKELEAEAKRLLIEMERLAIIDPLTGVFNRRYFNNRVMEELERANRYEHPLALMLMDIDHFKQINDTYGHPVGDKVLQSIAELCRKNLRGTDIIGRYGGDEFVFLLPETQIRNPTVPTEKLHATTMPTDASAVAERLRQEIARTGIETDQGTIQITVSLGIAGLSELGREREMSPQSREQQLAQLIAHADTALYSAKEAGRNCVKIFQPG